MDCTTARLMLEFARPGHVELEAPEQGALEAHVAACPECARTSQQERRFDEQLGQAMRQVDVPDRLRARLLTRLAEQRTTARKWRWKAAVGGVLAVAASLLLAVGGWLIYHQATLPPLDLDRIAEHEREQRQSPPSPQEIEEEFHRHGIDMKAPTSLNYAFLAFHGLGDLQGQQVPCLVFIRDDEAANIHAHVKVYVVSEREFNLKKVAANYQVTGYQVNVELEREPGSAYVYVIVNTGDNLSWLRRSDPSAD